MNISVHSIPFQIRPKVNIAYSDASAGLSYYGVTAVYSDSSVSRDVVKFSLYEDSKALGLILLSAEEAAIFKSELSIQHVFSGALPAELAA